MDYKATVNPTFFTAQQTLFMLAAAGNEDARMIIKTMGIENKLQGNMSDSDRSSLGISDEDKKALVVGATLAIEARYEALSRLLENGVYKNCLDIACGFTPRSLYCYKTGIDYVGLDVPAVVEQLTPFAADMMPDQKHAVYIAGDATNAASMKAAADMMQGELLITNEGLLTYFNKNEFAQFIEGIRAILLEHGGSWYTSDYCVDYARLSFSNMSSANAAREFAESKKKIMSSSDVYNDMDSFKDKEELKIYLAEHGFKVEEVPFYVEGEDLNMLKAVKPENMDTIVALLRSASVLKMTPDPAYTGTAPIAGAREIENLKIDYEISGGTLICHAKGRIDTISAPALLEIFDTHSEGLRTMQLDASKLEYISSAGLRVLMIARKKLGKDTVSVINASEEIKNIFMTTGFNNVILVR